MVSYVEADVIIRFASEVARSKTLKSDTGVPRIYWQARQQNLSIWHIVFTQRPP